MPTWAKVILIILAAIILFVCALGFIGYRWFKTHGAELGAEANKYKAEGTQFGKGKDPDACVDEAFARLKGCDGIMCEVRVKWFLPSCVAASNVPPDFCANIPPQNEIIASAKWAVAECARRGRARDERCPRIINELQDYCKSR